MAAVDFPANPSPGDVFGRWRWDGYKWLPSGLANPPEWAIADAPPGDVFGRTLGDWRAVMPASRFVFGNNRLRVGNILFQWGYIPATAGVDNWVYFDTAYSVMPCIQLTALHGGGGAATDQMVTAGIDHEGAGGFAYRMRYSTGGGVGVATQGFMWMAVGPIPT